MILRSSVPFFILISGLVVPGDSSNKIFKCEKEGRFPDPHNCVSYIDCLRMNSTSPFLYPRRDYCGKGGFHPTLRVCVPFKELNGCSAREARLVKNEVRDPDLDHICATGKGFLCADCKTQVHCVDGHAFVKKCKSNDVCAEREEFAGGVCHPDYVEECSCIQSYDFVADPYDPSGFFFCNEYAEPEYYKCSKNTVWDSNVDQCVRPRGAFPSCDKTGSGVFAHKENCRVFYKCIHVEGGWLQSDFECGLKQMFSDVNDRCENPCTWAKGKFTCETEGRFADNTDCRAYHECVDEGGRFRETKYYCPLDCVWQQFQDGTSGDCVKTEMAQCQEIATTQCDIPPDWCSTDDSSGPPSFEDSIFVGQGAQTAMGEGHVEEVSDSEEPLNPGASEPISGTVTLGENEESNEDDLAVEVDSAMFVAEGNDEVSNSDGISGLEGISEVVEGEGSESALLGGEGTDESSIDEETEEIIISDSEDTDGEDTDAPSNVDSEHEETIVPDIEATGDNLETNVEGVNVEALPDDNSEGNLDVDIVEAAAEDNSEGNPDGDDVDGETDEFSEDIFTVDTQGTEESNNDNITPPTEVIENVEAIGDEASETEENVIENDTLDFPTPPSLVEVVVNIGADELTGENLPAAENTNSDEETDESEILADIQNDLSLLNNFYKFKRRSRILEFL